MIKLIFLISKTLLTVVVESINIVLDLPVGAINKLLFIFIPLFSFNIGLEFGQLIIVFSMLLKPFEGQLCHSLLRLNSQH